MPPKKKTPQDREATPAEQAITDILAVRQLSRDELRQIEIGAPPER